MAVAVALAGHVVVVALRRRRVELSCQLVSWWRKEGRKGFDEDFSPSFELNSIRGNCNLYPKLAPSWNSRSPQRIGGRKDGRMEERTGWLVVQEFYRQALWWLLLRLLFSTFLLLLLYPFVGSRVSFVVDRKLHHHRKTEGIVSGGPQKRWNNSVRND